MTEIIIKALNNSDSFEKSSGLISGIKSLTTMAREAVFTFSIALVVEGTEAHPSNTESMFAIACICLRNKKNLNNILLKVARETYNYAHL